MKTGLIADTHIPSMGAEPPSQVVRAFEGVDLILHAGHVEIASCIRWLERIAPVTATTSWPVGPGEALPRVNTVKVVEVENHTIGICHELILKSLSDDVIPGGDREGVPSWRVAARRVKGHLWRTRGHCGLRLHPRGYG